IVVEVEVEGHKKGQDDNGNGKPSDEQPDNPINPGPSLPVPPNKPGEDEKPGDEDKVTDPTINPVTEGDKEISGTGKPGTDITVVITDKDGNKTEKTVKVGDDGKWKVVVDKDLKAGDKITATDSDGNKAQATVKAKPSKPAPKPDGSADWTGSSNLSERCINTGLGIGIPLLFLIPVGLASQLNIPGLSEFVAQINYQIQDLNTRLQQQTNTFNGPLAKQVADIDAQLSRFGADSRQAAGAVALIAAGALAIGLLADACAPGAGEGSSN
ncbi:Ig-like domain-containing protein, partial [uncultured Corynebacterium sp.]|uniref:Ig-like domain-containing protein n=1 Tax=uncultured Corynebacterium sp. TaxID=159447 RepID=UPI0025FB3B51